MKKVKKFFSSVRVKLCMALCIIVLSIIFLLIILNSIVLKQFYLYSKENALKTVYGVINKYCDTVKDNIDIISELEKISIRNNFDIIIKNDQNETIYISNRDFSPDFFQRDVMNSKSNRPSTDINILEEKEKYMIMETNDPETNIRYIMLAAILDNDYKLYARMPMTSIEESVEISNRFLYIIAIFVIIFGVIIIFIVSRRFSKPIEELETIANKMANLDFSQKYQVSNANDEIDNLGKSINALSDKLEATIEQLKNTNLELEKDVEEKSQLDEMRKSFISDVSHELKTPIALIQGYSEGLIEIVNQDEESRKFYAEVILDEATKMDRLVKRLLELMKLEYGKMEFNNTEFDIIEMEREILRKSQVMIQKENIEVQFEDDKEDVKPIMVYADDFYIEQVVTNYITNAIKYATEINGVKKMSIRNKVDKERGKVRVFVFNTLEGLSEDELVRIWNRFYKADESRNREKGGNGIGLALVKAIMNNYGNDYGAKNVAGGIEFYFDVDLSKEL